jgi:hypothetical protein
MLTDELLHTHHDRSGPERFKRDGELPQFVLAYGAGEPISSNSLPGISSWARQASPGVYGTHSACSTREIQTVGEGFHGCQ